MFVSSKNKNKNNHDFEKNVWEGKFRATTNPKKESGGADDYEHAVMTSLFIARRYETLLFNRDVTCYRVTS